MFVHKEAICTICGLESWLASRCTLGSCESPWPHRCCCCGCCVRCVLLRRITSSQVNSGHVMHVQVAGYDTTNHDTTPEIRCMYSTSSCTYLLGTATYSVCRYLLTLRLSLCSVPELLLSNTYLPLCGEIPPCLLCRQNLLAASLLFCAVLRPYLLSWVLLRYIGTTYI